MAVRPPAGDALRTGSPQRRQGLAGGLVLVLVLPLLSAPPPAAARSAPFRRLMASCWPT